jgi:hypothetical protein
MDVSKAGLDAVVHEQAEAFRASNDDAEIVRLAEKMLTLQKERQSVRPEDDLDRVRNLERQIAHVDAEIDQRVYELPRSATLRG